jgi:acetyl esterase/lipase
MPRFILLLFALSAVVVSADEALFKRWDKDKNGQLSREEVTGPMRRHFERVDIDGSDSISLAEHNIAFAYVRQRAANTKASIDGLDLRHNVAYAGTDNPRQKLDLALPKTRGESPVPMLVYIHGGAWRAGQKEQGWNRLKPFVSDGKIAGASIGYRLSNEAIWPAQIHDCKAAIRWLKANAKDLGIDPDRIIVYGSSAGGHLVSMLGLTDTPELEGALGPHTDLDSKVAGVINFFGPSGFEELAQLAKADVAGSSLRLLFGGPLKDKVDAVKQASPLRHVTAGDAPFIHFHGTKDPIVPFSQSELLHAALAKAKVPSTLITIKGGGHGFRGKRIDALIQTFLDQTLFGAEKFLTDTTLAADALK